MVLLMVVVVVVPLPLLMATTLASPLLPMAVGLNMLMGFVREPTGDTGFCAGVMLGDMFEASGWRVGIKKGDDFGVADPEDGGDAPVAVAAAAAAVHWSCCRSCCCCWRWRYMVAISRIFARDSSRGFDSCAGCMGIGSA